MKKEIISLIIYMLLVFINLGMTQTVIVPDFRVNDVKTHLYGKTSPHVLVSNNGVITTTWTDKRNGDANIYIQRYLNDGIALGSNFKLYNSIENSVIERYSNISGCTSGNFVIVWLNDYSTMNVRGDICAQRYSNDGANVGLSFKVNDDTGNNSQWYPSISMNDEKFIIVWEDGRNSDIYDTSSNHHDIYAQCYLNNGALIGSNFKVNDELINVAQQNPVVALLSDGTFMIVWEDKRNFEEFEFDIYAQLYNSNGDKIGVNFRVNDDTEKKIQYCPSIVAGDNVFVVVWGSYFSGDQTSCNIYVQRYSSDGIALDSNFKVNDDQDGSIQTTPSVSMNNNSFIVAWNNRINSETNSNIYAQRYLDDGSRVGNNFIVTYDENKEQRSSSIGLWNNQIYTVWEIEHIDGIGYNQYMNILNWDVTVPVELCNFRTITHDDVVILNWETLSESNNYGFEVQRMISDKDSWETIGFVNGKGTTNVLQSYSYKDKLLSDGEFLYRLKQIDFDGSFIYSDSICVSVNKMITNYLVQNYPNPFNSSTTVSFNLDKKDNVKLNVYNTLGQKVKSVIDDKLDVGSHQITINMNDMTSGLYFCRLEMNERVEVKKILLQK